jgi:hypothetical protein
MAAPIAAIIARQALNKFGDQLPAGVKEAISFVDNPRATAQSVIRNAVKDKIQNEVMGNMGAQYEEGMFEPRPESDFASFRGEGLGGGGKGGMDLDLRGGEMAMKRGGKVKSVAKAKMKVSSASRRGDGIAQRGKTRGKMC